MELYHLSPSQHGVLKTQQGTSLVEVIAAILLLLILSVGLVRSNMLSSFVRGKTIRNANAMHLALTSMEEFAATNPTLLDDTDDVTESVTFEGRNFSRVIDVTVNADGSRTIEITVTGTNALLGGNASLTNTFALWGAS